MSYAGFPGISRVRITATSMEVFLPIWFLLHTAVALFKTATTRRSCSARIVTSTGQLQTAQFDGTQ